MVGLKENLDILNHEHQMLSQELTDKQNDFLRSQRELAKAESELIQLRPLREHLQHLNADQHRQIEDSTRQEYEKNKLLQKTRELETQLTLISQQNADLSDNYKRLASEKQALVQQLTQFEKDSFEIQTKVKRGLELASDSEKSQSLISQL